MDKEFDSDELAIEVKLDTNDKENYSSLLFTDSGEISELSELFPNNPDFDGSINFAINDSEPNSKLEIEDLSKGNESNITIIDSEKMLMPMSMNASRLSTQVLAETESNINGSKPTEIIFIEKEIINCPYLDGKFFEVTQRHQDNNVTAKCQLCVAKITFIKGKIGVSTNFLKHMKKFHLPHFQEYEKYKIVKKQSNKEKSDQQLKRKFSIDENEITVNNPIANKRAKIQTKLSLYNKNANFPSQQGFDKKLIHFIIDSMVPISILERESFSSLFEGTNLKIFGRTTATKKIKELCMETMECIKKDFCKCKYICTTADIWSAKRRSFMGVTAHWIDDDFNRKSVALSCQRFYGTHSFDKIADMLQEINNNFGITNKLVATVTDNGSNFVKAFKEYQKKDTTVDDLNDEEEIAFHIISDDRSVQGLEGPILPNHIRCASHTLNLIATTDIKNVIEKNTQLRTRNTNSVAKCNVLWKMAGKPKSAEVIQKVLQHTLSYPGATRWNSFFDSVFQIIREKDKLVTLFKELGIENQMFKDIEIQYLSEYCKILKPLADGLDILQGELNIYYGYLLPTLGSILKKFEKINSDNEKLIYTQHIIKTAKQSILKRFEKIFDVSNAESQQAIIAAFTVPQFKLRWTSNFKAYIKEDLNEYAPKLIMDNICANTANNNHYNNEAIKEQVLAEQSFFELDNLAACTSSDPDVQKNQVRKKIELELLQYLNDVETDITMLNKYPTIKELFFKYNTCLPSSAPVERLFSFAEIINAPRRNALSDLNFEYLVLMKANSMKFVK